MSRAVSDLVQIERRDDGVAVVRLDNPKVNALSSEVLTQLEAAARALDRRSARCRRRHRRRQGVRRGRRHQRVRRTGGGRADRRLFLSSLRAVAAIPRATIAAVSGYALGGGCELALACDFRIASTRARFGQPEILLGIIPGGGGTQRLPRLVGVARAKDIILTGRQVDADEALRIGLVDEVVEPDALFDRAVARAAEFAAGAVVAQGLAKRAIDVGLDGALAAGLDLEQRLFAEVFGTDDARTGVASFLEHGPGKAAFKGR